MFSGLKEDPLKKRTQNHTYEIRNPREYMCVERENIKFRKYTIQRNSMIFY